MSNKISVEIVVGKATFEDEVHLPPLVSLRSNISLTPDLNFSGSSRDNRRFDVTLV